MNGIGNSKPLRILVVRVGAMGDVLHGMPAVAALRAALPDTFIGWAVEPRWSSLLRAPDVHAGGPGMPLVDRVHLAETKAWSKRPVSVATVQSIASLRRGLRNERYDLAIDLQGSIRSAVIARLSGAPLVVGSATPRETPARFLYTQRVPLCTAHVVEQAVEIVSAAIGRTLQPAATRLPIDAAAETWCDTILGDDTRPVAFLAPTAGWGAKQWPARRFGELAVALDAAGLRVLVNRSGPGDRVSEEVVRDSHALAEPVECTVSELATLLRRVAVVIAGDTGPLHLADALGRPTVALFGPTDPTRNGPFAGPSRILRHPSSRTDHRRQIETEAGLARIPTADAVSAVADLLGLSIPFRPDAG